MPDAPRPPETAFTRLQSSRGVTPLRQGEHQELRPRVGRVTSVILAASIPNKEEQIDDSPKEINPATLAQPGDSSVGISIPIVAAETEARELSPWAQQNLWRQCKSPIEYIQQLRKVPGGTTVFAYMRTRDDGSLELCSYNDVSSKDYYTISLSGVTRVLEDTSEFTPLDEWLEGHELLSAIRQIRFFKQFRLLRAFKRWRSVVVRTKFHKYSVSLNSKLFTLNSTLRPALFQIRLLCRRLSNLTTEIGGTSRTKPLSLRQFAESETERRKQLAIHIGNIVTEIAAITSEACTDSMSACFDGARGRVDATPASSDQVSVISADCEGLLPGARDPSMVHARRAARRTHSERLAGFVQLIDFLIADALHTLVITWTRDIDERFQACVQSGTGDRNPNEVIPQIAPHTEPEPEPEVKPRPKKPQVGLQKKVAPPFDPATPVITVRLSVIVDEIESPRVRHRMDYEALDDDQGSDDSSSSSIGGDDLTPAQSAVINIGNPERLRSISPHIQLDPSGASILEAVEFSLHDLVAVVCIVNPLLNHTDFSEYAAARLDAPPPSELPPVAHLLTTTHQFNDVLEGLSTLIDHSYDVLRDWSGAYQIYVDAYSALQAVNTEVPPIPRYQEHPLFRVSEMALKFRTDEATLDDIARTAFDLAPDFQNASSLLFPDEESERLTVPIPHTSALSVLSQRLESCDEIARLASALPDETRVGPYLIDVSAFHSQLMLCPPEAILQLTKLLPDLITEKCAELRETIMSCIQVLNATMQSVRDYVARVAFVSVCSLGGLARIDSDARELRELVQLATDRLQQSEQEPLSEDLMAEVTACQQAVQSFKQSLSAVEASKADDGRYWRHRLIEDGQELADKAGEVKTKANNQKYDSVESNVDACVSELQGLLKETEELKVRAADQQQFTGVLGADKHDFPAIESAEEAARVRLQIWQATQKWHELESEALETPFGELDAEHYMNEIKHLLRDVFEADSILKGSPPASSLEASLTQAKQIFSIVSALRLPSMLDRHWNEVETVLCAPIPGRRTESADATATVVLASHGDPSDVPPGEGMGNLTLEWLLHHGLIQNMPGVEAVSARASNEATIRGMLQEVENTWSQLPFTVIPYRDSRDIYILGSLDDVLATLDSTQLSVSAMRASRYVAPLKDQVEAWYQKLSLAQQVIDYWVQFQRIWLYLEPIFSTPDMQRQLPAEARLFSVSHAFWRELMFRCHDHPLALAQMTVPSLHPQLVKHTAALEKVQRGLEDYLDTKRQAFGRFYFLSNDELLAILSQTRDPTAVQPHLRKCFEGLVHAVFSSEKEVIAFESAEGERVECTRPVRARGAVEGWLGALEKTMRESVRQSIRRTLETGAECSAEARGAWARSNCSQFTIVCSQILWSLSIEQTFTQQDPLRALRAFRDEWNKRLQSVVAESRNQLTSKELARITPLITIDVHARDIIDGLIEKQVTTANDFSWQTQLRYAWDEQDCVVSQLQSTMLYGHEYLGSTSRLVVTPLTDRCYLTLTTALSLCLGGAPAGPAGTGKTETVKDLSKALGLYCTVFNASEELEVGTLSRFFKGICFTGAFLCLDEFNRILLEVLSVVAGQIATIQTALQAQLRTFQFDGQEISLNPRLGIFVTMNPGYAGRTELPDNLKALFRPVAMMVPDYALIAEISLFAEGFQDARMLAHKMVYLYRLASEQLSPQPHYDFGLRAVKAILSAAGSLFRAHPELDEQSVLITAMQDANNPKLLAPDLLLFEAIVCDLFPGTTLPEASLDLLKEKAVEAYREAGLTPLPIQLQKIQQLYTTTRVRHGVMVLGGAGGGKSTVRTMLRDAMNRLASEQASIDNVPIRQIHEVVVNPKSLTMRELFGAYSETTQEWADGVAAVTVREMVQDQQGLEQWLVFDGPVDTLWIESINSTLDDNRLLCLASGERIKITLLTHILFELDDLSEASPATVSRCGMVLVEPQTLDSSALILSWVNKLELETGSVEPLVDPNAEPQTSRNATARGSGARELIYNLLSVMLPQVLQRVHKEELAEPMPTCDTGLINSVLTVLGAFLSVNPLISKDSKINGHINLATFEPAARRTLLGQLVILSMVWGLSSYLSLSELKIDSIIRDACQGLLPMIPPSGTFFDYAVTLESIGNGLSSQFTPWSQLVAQYEHTTVDDAFVPTIETTRLDWLLRSILASGSSALLVAPSGVGKTIIARSVLKKLRSDEELCGPTTSVAQQLTARSTAAAVQQTIESMLVQKRRGLLGAPPTFTGGAVAFVDDISSPAPEQFGAQPPLEILRQLLDSGGWYDRTTLSWLEVQGTRVLAACTPASSGHPALPSRLQRFFVTIAVPEASDQGLQHIFTSIVRGHSQSKSFGTAVTQQLVQGVQATISLYRQALEIFLPTPAKSHYMFSLRDVSSVVRSMLRADPAALDSQDKSSPVVSLWRHEIERVFCDRLTCAEDREQCRRLLADSGKMFFGTTESVEQLYPEPGSQCSSLQPWFAFRHPHAPPDRRKYEPAEDGEVIQVLQQALQAYNAQATAPLPLVLFPEAAQNTSSIARVLGQPSSHALLVGVSGGGRRSLTRLAAFVTGCNLISPMPSRGYGVAQFRDDLRSAVVSAGAEGQPTVFLMAEEQITDNAFLDDICALLTNSEVTGLFAPDQLEEAMVALSPAAEEAEIPSQRDEMWRFFVSRVRTYLHVVLCLSPSDHFRLICRMFPALISCTTTIWFSEWSQAALRAVTESRFAALNLGNTEALVDIAVSIQASIQAALHTASFVVHTPPPSFLELLSSYQRLLEEKRREVGGRRDRFKIGLEKLLETQSAVSQLQLELEELKPKLNEGAKKTQELLVQLSEQTAAAEVVKQNAEEEEAVVREKANAANALAEDAENDLAKALPALEAAVKALNALNKNDVNEIRSFPSPPDLVRVVMEAVLTLLQKSTDWASAKTVLSDPGFLRSLVEFNRDDIPAGVLKKLRKYTSMPEFDPDNVARVSLAAKSLCLWCRAIDVYAATAKEVAPKKARVEEARATLASAQALLAEKQAALAEVQAKLNSLQETYDTQSQENARLEAELDLTQARLQRAQQLVGLLSGEQTRWEEQNKVLSEAYERLPADCLISAAALTYLGPFSGAQRVSMQSKWRALCKQAGLIVSPDASLLSLAAPVEIREWHLQGLPADDFSAENAILSTKSRRYPLIVDAQSQCVRWLRAWASDKGLVEHSADSPDLMAVVERCIRLGSPLLITGITEDIDPSLMPVLAQITFKQHGRTLMHLGDSDIDVDPGFRLFLVTQLSSPVFPPEIQMHVTLVNFSATEPAFEEQLLGQLMVSEQPELEEKRAELIVSLAADRKQLDDLAERILVGVSNTETNILDNEELISVLQESRSTSDIITRRLEASHVTGQEIDSNRDLYRPLARLGALLYFSLNDLGRRSPVYAPPALDVFSDMFGESLVEAEQSTDLPTRLLNVRQVLIKRVFSSVARRIFSSDMLAFTLSLCLRLQLREGFVSLRQVQVLVAPPPSDSALSSAAVVRSKKVPDGIPPRGWRLLCYLADDQEPYAPRYHWLAGKEAAPSAIPIQRHGELFSAILDSIQQSPEKWAAWAEGQPTPLIAVGSYCGSVEHRVLRAVLARALLPDRLTSFAQDVISDYLGSEYIQAATTRVTDAVKETNIATPLVFLLSPGADPLNELQTAHAAQPPPDNELPLSTVSLGQGQGVVAERLIVQASLSGGWVFLANAHLGASWMPTLARIVEALTIARRSLSQKSVVLPPPPIVGMQMPPHPSFRLIISAQPTSTFPLSVLQHSVRLTTEPPAGLRTSLMRTFAELTEQHWKSPLYYAAQNVVEKMAIEHSLQPDIDVSSLEQFIPQACLLAYRKLLYATAFYHAVLQERRSFGPLGWNVDYAFNNCDLITAFRQVATQLVCAVLPSSLQRQPFTIPWEALRYLCADVDYGGRITDQWDLRLGQTLLKSFYCPEIVTEAEPDLGFGVLDAASHFQYTMPVTGIEITLDDVRSAIAQLPVVGNPVILGLSDTAQAALRRRKVDQLLEAMRVTETDIGDGTIAALLQPAIKSAHKVEETASTDNEEEQNAQEEAHLPSVAELRSLRDTQIANIAAAIVARLPNTLSRRDACAEAFQYNENGLPFPLSTTLDQEMTRFNNLLSIVRSSLVDMQRAVRGEIVLSPVLEEVLESLHAGKVPPTWAAAAYPSLRHLQDWIDDLIARAKFFETWLTRGPPNAFWLPGFFFPQGFLTSVLQIYARKHQVPVDSLSFTFSILTQSPEEIDSPPEDGVYVTGLFLEGARLEGTQLQEATSIVPQQLPVIHFLPAVNPVRDPSDYECPLYKTSERQGSLGTTGLSTSYIVTVYLSAGEASRCDKWIRSSVAILCEPPLAMD